MEYKKILVVDDHPIVREGLRLIFETEDQLNIADEATNGEEALILIKNNTYDLILLDIRMPVMDGLEFLKEKARIKDETSVVILTTADDSDTINKAMEYGVKGFMLKDSTREVMFQTVHAALNNEVSLSPDVLKILEDEKNRENNLEKTPGNGLTEREIVVLRSIVRGATSKEIAIDMGITERTVKAHLTSIYRKLEVNSRSEAVAVAITNKIVNIPKL